MAAAKILTASKTLIAVKTTFAWGIDCRTTSRCTSSYRGLDFRDVLCQQSRQQS